MNEKIKEGVYTQSFKNKKVIYEYKKLEDVPFKDYKTLFEYTKILEMKIADLEAYKKRTENLERVFEETIRGFITK